MTRFRASRTALFVGLCAMLGAGVGFILSSALANSPVAVYRGSISGIFLSEEESHFATRAYVEASSPSVTLVLRATPSSRSASRAGYLAEMYSLLHPTNEENSEESFSSRRLAGHTSVQAVPGTEILTVKSWSQDPDVLASEAFRQLLEIDAEAFGSDVDPLILVHRLESGARVDVSQSQNGALLFTDVAQSHLLAQSSAPSLLPVRSSLVPVRSSLESIVSSDRFRSFLGDGRSVSTRLTFSEERRWNIDFEGPNVAHVNESISEASSFLLATLPFLRYGEILGGALLLESTTDAQILDEAAPFSPVVTSTASGFFGGLAVGWGVVGFLQTRSSRNGRAPSQEQSSQLG